MDTIAIRNVQAVDRLLASPTMNALTRINKMGKEDARLFLRYFAAQENRWSIEQWEWAQLAIGLGLILLLVFGTRPPKIAIGLSLLMFVIVLIQRIGLSPSIDRLGREIDFMPTNSNPPLSFTGLRDAYSVIELVKLGLGLGVAGLLLLRKPADPGMFARENEAEEAVSPRPPQR